jgi:hypothetical protein
MTRVAEQDTLDLSSGGAMIEIGLDEPGQLLLEVTIQTQSDTRIEE